MILDSIAGPTFLVNDKRETSRSRLTNAAGGLVDGRFPWDQDALVTRRRAVIL